MVNIDDPVTEIMTTSVVVTTPGASIPELARLMVDHDISGVPVVGDDGRLVGVVSEADLVTREMEVDLPVYGTFLDAVFQFPWGHADEELRRVLATTVGEVMTREVVSLLTNATIQDAASVMVKRRVNPVPIVDADQRVVGIISRSDIIRLIAADAGQ